MILNENNKWVEAEPEDQREIASTKEVKEILTMNQNDYNKIIGFIGYEKKNKYLVFKTKDMTSKRDTGARCDESGKDKTINKINEIVGEVTEIRFWLGVNIDAAKLMLAIDHVQIHVAELNARLPRS